MTSTKLNGHFTSFPWLSKWQRYFVFIPSLRSKETDANKVVQWVEGVLLTSVLFLQVSWQIKPYRDGEDDFVYYVLVTFVFGQNARQQTKTEEKRCN